MTADQAKACELMPADQEESDAESVVECDEDTVTNPDAGGKFDAAGRKGEELHEAMQLYQRLRWLETTETEWYKEFAPKIAAREANCSLVQEAFHHLSEIFDEHGAVLLKKELERARRAEIYPSNEKSGSRRAKGGMRVLY